MVRIIKFELFKTVRENVLKICIIIALLVTIVMLSGTDITIESFVQRSFLVSIIASLYAAFYASKDFEGGKILYPVLSGNSRIEIVTAKLIAVFIGTEILNLIFPITVFCFYPEWDISLKIRILFAYVLLGSILAVIGELLAWILKKQGVAVLATIICHIGSLLLMNGENTSKITMHIIPIGIVKLWMDGEFQIIYGITFCIWFVVPFIATMIIAQHSEM